MEDLFYDKDSFDEDSDDEEKPKVVLTPNSIGHAVVWPLFAAAWMEGLPNNVSTAIVHMNKAVFNSDKKKSKQMWKDRASTFNKALKCA